MFAPPADPPAPPKSAPFIPTLEADSGPFFEEMRATDETTKGVIGAMISVLATNSTVNNATDLSRNCAAMFQIGSAEAYVAFMATAVADDPTEEDVLRALITSNEGSCLGWICDLVNASKKKTIDGDNVMGYFESLGRSSVKGGPIALFVNRMADFLPDNIMDDAFRNGLTQNKWTEYHSSRVSTGKILVSFVDAFLDLGIFRDADQVHTAILDCAENSHNVSSSNDIPDKVIGYGNIYLEVCGTPISNWYQGRKCEANLPNSRVKAIKMIFKKYNELIHNIEGIEESETVAGLSGQIGNGFW